MPTGAHPSLLPDSKAVIDVEEVVQSLQEQINRCMAKHPERFPNSRASKARSSEDLGQQEFRANSESELEKTDVSLNLRLSQLRTVFSLKLEYSPPYILLILKEADFSTVSMSGRSSRVRRVSAVRVWRLSKADILSREPLPS